MTEQRLQVLPNKDLWRGHRRVEKSTVVEPTTGVSVELGPLDKAMEAIISCAKGGPLNCLWCGQQFAELEMRGHLLKYHPSVVKPITGPEAAMHTAAAAQQELELTKEK